MIAWTFLLTFSEEEHYELIKTMVEKSITDEKMVELAADILLPAIAVKFIAVVTEQTTENIVKFMPEYFR